MGDCPICRKKYAGYELNKLGTLAESNVGLIFQRTIEAIFWLFVIKFTSTINWHFYPDRFDITSGFDRILNWIAIIPFSLAIHMHFLIPLLNRIRNLAFDDNTLISMFIGVFLHILLNIFCTYLFIFFL